MDEKQIVAMIATILEFVNPAKEITPLMIRDRYRANLDSVIKEHEGEEQRAKIDEALRRDKGKRP